MLSHDSITKVPARQMIRAAASGKMIQKRRVEQLGKQSIDEDSLVEIHPVIVLFGELLSIEAPCQKKVVDEDKKQRYEKQEGSE